MEKNLDIDRIVINIAFIKNNKDGNVNANMNLTIAITIFIIVCRFISMWYMPDVFCDEQEILNHMKSIIATGHDTQGNYMPLYPVVGAGRATFTYLYPMIAGLSILGVSAISARFIQ